MSSDERWAQLRKEVRKMHPDYRLILEKLEQIPVEGEFTVPDLGAHRQLGGGATAVLRAAIALKVVAPTGGKRGRHLIYLRLR